MDHTKLDQFFALSHYFGTLKHLKRTGWVKRGINNPETVAAHSHRMSALAMHLSPELTAVNIDPVKVIKMCIIHDIGEAKIGDIITGSIPPADKRRMEEAAVRAIAQESNNTEMLELWLEMEDGKTPEAQFAKDLDIIDMHLQAFEYLKSQPDKKQGLQEFFNYCTNKTKTRLGTHINNALTLQIQAYQKEQKT